MREFDKQQQKITPESLPLTGSLNSSTSRLGRRARYMSKICFILDNPRDHYEVNSYRFKPCKRLRGDWNETLRRVVR